jgi:hypothetical protein
MHGGTALGTAIWSAINEPRREHPQIIDELLKAGARLGGVEYPTRREGIDAILRRYGFP